MSRGAGPAAEPNRCVKTALHGSTATSSHPVGSSVPTRGGPEEWGVLAVESWMAVRVGETGEAPERSDGKEDGLQWQPLRTDSWTRLAVY